MIYFLSYYQSFDFCMAGGVEKPGTGYTKLDRGRVVCLLLYLSGVISIYIITPRGQFFDVSPVISFRHEQHHDSTASSAGK